LSTIFYSKNGLIAIFFAKKYRWGVIYTPTNIIEPKILRAKNSKYLFCFKRHFIGTVEDQAIILAESKELNKLKKLKKDLEGNLEKIKSELEDDNFKFVAIHRLGNETEKIRDFKKCFIHYLYVAVSTDGNVYPCNYHPKVDGYTYDSAITNKFGDIWENIKKYEIDKNIPKICLNRCDPFKTRANRLLEVAYEIYKEEEIESLKDFIFEK